MSIQYFGCELVKDKSFNDNEGNERFRFKITSDKIDRIGDKIIPNGIDISDYLQNNIVLYNHDYETIIGNSIISMSENGKEMYADAYFDEESDISKRVKRQIQKGTLKAASIGLRVLETTQREPTVSEQALINAVPWVKKVTDITKSQLIEWSVVTIPMNPDAMLTRAIQKGIDTIDIDLMKKSFIGDVKMENENTIIEKAGATLSKTNMSDLTEAARLINKVLDSAMKEPDENVPQDEKSLESDVAKIAELTNQITEMETEKVMLNKKINELELNVKNMEKDLQFTNLLKGI